MSRIRMYLLLALVVLAVVPGRAWADDTFTATNPATGQTESVWSAVPLGGSAEIFFAVLQGTQWSASEQITSNSTPDQNPHLAFSAQGDRRVAWWRDDTTDAIYYSSKPASGGSWSTPILVSTGSEDARYPRLTEFNGTVFIAYETVPQSGSRKVVVSKQEGPNPWPSVLVATAAQSTRLYVQVHNESGHLWVDWVDSGSYLGWSEYVSGTWSSPQYESYSGNSDVETGRTRIRGHVLGL